MVVNARVVVDKVALGTDFSLSTSVFLCLLSFHTCSILASGVGIIGSLVPVIMKDLVSPHS
jgi:hypothetical protein